MTAILLALAFTWPTECAEVGRLYEGAAKIRDGGITMEEAARNLTSQTARTAILHVYSRPDMSARDWRHYIIGVCVGSMPQEQKPNAPMMRPSFSAVRA